MLSEKKLITVRLSDSDCMRSLSNAVHFGALSPCNRGVYPVTSSSFYGMSLYLCVGTPVLIENIGEELDPVLEPLLLKQTFKQGGVWMIKLGDEAIEYTASFRYANYLSCGSSLSLRSGRCEERR